MSRQAKKASSTQIASLQNPAALHLQRKKAVNANDPAGLGVEVAAGKGPYLSRLSDIGKSLNKSNSEQPNSKKLVPAKPSNSTTGSIADSAEKPKGAESPREPKTEIKQEAKHEPKAPSKSPDEKAPPAGEKTQQSKKGEEIGKKEKSPKSPEEDPEFQSVVKKAKSIAGAQKRHPEPKSESQKGMGAAKPPERERHTTAEAEQIAGVNEVAKEKPIPFSREAFKTALDSEIKKIHITTEEEANDFKKSGAAASIKAGVVGTVEQSKGQSQGPIQGAITQAPKVDSVKEEKPTELVTPNVGPAPPTIGAEMAVPKPLPNSEISMYEEGEKLDRQMSDADITEEQLQNSNEPEFQNAVSEKSKAQAQITEGPVLYRQEEQNLLEAAKGEATGVSGDHMQSIYSSRKNQFKNSFGEQKAAKTKNEEKRAKVVADIEAIYVDTKKKVDERFKKMDTDVDKRFDEGADNARTQFENTVSAVAERYSGISGEAAKLWDWATGPPEWVEKAFTDGRDLYVSLMEKTIDEVATIVEVGLKEAKDIIEAGWQSIQNYKSGLSADLVKFADEATSNIEGKFDALRQSVEDKFNGLVESLAKKYNENLKKVDDRVKQMKEDMRPGIAKAIDAIKGVIKTISKLKDMLLGVLARIANVVTKIIKDPIGFVGNLVKGVKAGLENFVGKIGEYLKQGLFEWLFGALGEAGIKMPDSLDFKGILSLVLQVLGLTYAAIRGRAVNLLGEGVVKGLEQASEIFVTLVSEGPAGLWKYVQEKLVDLKDTVIEGIKSFLIEKVIVAGITWIVGLLNPASAFIKAAKAIYDIVMFFVTRGSQIVSLIDALIDSMGAIADGGIGVAAAAIEKALGKAVPVVIGFLAGLLGLGGISEKVGGIIKKVQAPVNKAVDWLISKAASTVKSAGKLFASKKEKSVKDENIKLDSKGVKQAVAAELQGKSVGSLQEEESIVSEMFVKYQPKGLKSIKLHPTKTGISVLVGASLVEEVVKLDLRKRADQNRLLALMKKFRYLNKATHILTYYQGTQVDEVRNYLGHAERNFVFKTLPKVERRIIADLNAGKLSPTSSITVELAMTRTPCYGCATTRVPEALSVLKANPLLANMDIHLSIEATALTSSTLGGLQGLEKLLKQENVEVKSSDFWSVIFDILKPYPQFYDEVTTQHWRSDQLRDFQQANTDLKAEIDSIEAREKSGLKDISKG